MHPVDIVAEPIFQMLNCLPCHVRHLADGEVRCWWPRDLGEQPSCLVSASRQFTVDPVCAFEGVQQPLQAREALGQVACEQLECREARCWWPDLMGSEAA